MRVKVIATICATVVLVAAATTAIAQAVRSPKTTVVNVADNFYSAPAMRPVANGTLSIRLGDSLKWKWAEFGDSHDLRIKRPLPKGYPGRNDKTKRAYRGLYSADNPGGSYLYKFNVAGTYKLYCSFHSGEMVMTVRVAK
ncbi:MAG: plastocyanin/azurin family copper-binding protein [Actinomycetota bacterium]